MRTGSTAHSTWGEGPADNPHRQQIRQVDRHPATVKRWSASCTVRDVGGPSREPCSPSDEHGGLTRHHPAPQASRPAPAQTPDGVSSVTTATASSQNFV